MFTRTVDGALDRHMFGHIEVAFTHDYDAVDPMSWNDYLFAGIQRNHTNCFPSDQDGHLTEYDRLLDHKEEALDNLNILGSMWADKGVDLARLGEEDKVEEYEAYEYIDSMMCYDDAVEEMNKYREYNLRARDEDGWPEFRIVINVDLARENTGLELATEESIEELAQGIVDSYGAWAEGSVYVVGIENHETGDDDDIMGGVYGNTYSREFAAEVANSMGYEVTV